MTTDKTPTAEERADLRKLWEPHTVVARLLDALDAAERAHEQTKRVMMEADAGQGRRIFTLEADLAAAKGQVKRLLSHEMDDEQLAILEGAYEQRVANLAIAGQAAAAAVVSDVLADLRQIKRDLTNARADLARVTAERDEAIRHRAETNEEIRKLHAMIRGKGFSVEDSVALHDFKTAWLNAREEIKRLTALLDERTAERDARERERDAARVLLKEAFGIVAEYAAGFTVWLDAARKEAGL